ncbi:MAG: hypothetical protein IPM54_24485 [Polyangiaceae bacterium]|nr:hypothetical protein [Polyangiaceae bacterium]
MAKDARAIVDDMRHHGFFLPIIACIISCGGDAPKVHAPPAIPSAAKIADKPCVNPPASASAADPSAPPKRYDVKTVMIPMRDGVHLETRVFSPLNADAPLPMLLDREPYGIPKDEAFAHAPADLYLGDDFYHNGAFRNPQKYVKNIFEATEADFITAVQQVSRSREAPSAIVLPVIAK